MSLIPQTSATSDAEKRYFPRWQVRNRVVYRIEGDMNFHEGRSCDLSCAGISLISRFSLSIPQRLKLRIYLFEEDHIEVEGHLVWSRESVEGHLAGVHFVNTSTEIQDKILKYAFEIKKSDVVTRWFDGWDKK